MMKNRLSATNEDKDLENFEAHLRFLAKVGQIPFSVSEKEIETLRRECTGMLLPSQGSQKYLSSVKKAYEDLAVEKARRKLFEASRPFGRHIQFLRKEASISVRRLAERLGRDAIFVEKLESGELSPLKVPYETISDLMEIFKINLRELISCIKVWLEISSKAGVAPAHARADRKMRKQERLEDLSAAIEDLVYASSKSEPQEFFVPDDFLSGVKKELERRSRVDLIK